jgi:protoporphyrin/coproporphyrin ferrochelatase
MFGKVHSLIIVGDKYPYYIYETCTLVQQYLKQHGVQLEFELGYQSKVGFQTWLQPSTSDLLKSMVNKFPDTKNIIISPVGFTSDHLETIYEIDQFLLPEV